MTAALTPITRENAATPITLTRLRRICSVA